MRRPCEARKRSFVSADHRLNCFGYFSQVLLLNSDAHVDFEANFLACAPRGLRQYPPSHNKSRGSCWIVYLDSKQHYAKVNVYESYQYISNQEDSSAIYDKDPENAV